MDFDRYKRTIGWNTAINRRQFAIDAPQFRWPEQYRYPDVTYQKRMRFRSGDLTFELRNNRGETDDATWTWVPEKKLLAPGDYSARSKLQESSMARNILNHAALASAEGKRDLAGNA